MSKYSFALREGAEHKSKETGTGLRGLWKYSFPICAGILILLLLGVSSRVELLYDELTYVIGGATALRNFATLTFAPEFWSFEFHPPFMMYFYGLAFGAYVVVRTLFTKGWVSIDELTIQAAILAKDETTIQFFRIPSFIAGVLILYFVYRWGEKLLGNRTGAVCSMILLITLPPFIGMSSVAYLEIGMALLQLMAAYYFLSSLKEKNWNQYFLSAVLVGCAASTKIFAGVIGFVILVHMLYWGRKEAARRGMTFPEALQWLNRNKKVFLWFPIVPLVIYIAWPWLWTDPSLFFKNLFSQMGFYGHGFYKGTNLLGHDYYLVYLAVSTPLPFLFSALLGLYYCFRERRDMFWLLATWFVLGIGIISMAKGRHGGYRHILPVYLPLAIAGGYGVQRFFQDLVRKLPGTGQVLTVFTAGLALSWLLLANVRVFPYQFTYFNELAGDFTTASQRYIFADAGLGQKEAIRYIDEHAPRGSTVWIWGTKPNSFLYSRRVNVPQSLGNSAIFTSRKKQGMGQNESIYPVKYFGAGDLIFHFPYFDEISKDIPYRTLLNNNVSYVVIQRLFTYPGINPGKGQEKLLKEIMGTHKPVFTNKILGVPVSWVFKIKNARSAP